jgi:hypothetical protein
VQLERLSLENESEILALLQDVWPRLYGATGCPQFSSDYLRWLYGGPDAERHLLLGCRIEGRLVGFKASLSRDLRLGGLHYTSGLATHLTIDPNLSPAIRLSVAGELSRLHVLNENAGPEVRDIALAVFEANKTLVRNITRMAHQQGLNLYIHRFRQATLNSRRASVAASYVKGITVRGAEFPADLPAIQKLVSRCPPSDLDWTPDVKVMMHHMMRAPSALVLIAEDSHGEASGLLASYCMDWLKNATITRMLIVEQLWSTGLDAAALLMAAAARHSAEQGYRGIVVENPTLLPAPMAEAIGLVEGAREMVLAMRSRRPLPQAIGGFTLDIK